jgi:Ala-tRNA(Pro) deacylase
MHGIEAVIHFLEREQARYELIEHPATFAAVDEARATGSALERMAKTVMLHDHAGFRTAVIPASERLDLHKARRPLKGSGHLRLASEGEIARAFPAFDPGALPPFGALLGTPEVLDQRLVAHRHILCSGGDRCHSLKISPHEIERLGGPLIADLCQPHRVLSEKERLLTHKPEGAQMPSTKTPAARRRATRAARTRAEDDARRLEHITQSLEAIQKDLGAIGGSVGTGVRDLRHDVNRLLRDARRDLVKMRRAIRRDLDRLQKDVTSAAKATTATPRRTGTTTTTRTAKRRRAASSH